MNQRFNRTLNHLLTQSKSRMNQFNGVLRPSVSSSNSIDGLLTHKVTSTCLQNHGRGGKPLPDPNSQKLRNLRVLFKRERVSLYRLSVSSPSLLIIPPLSRFSFSPLFFFLSLFSSLFSVSF